MTGTTGIHHDSIRSFPRGVREREDFQRTEDIVANEQKQRSRSLSKVCTISVVMPYQIHLRDKVELHTKRTVFGPLKR